MSKTKFLADECTFFQTVQLIKKLGFDVERIQDLGMTGARDSDVFAKVQEKKAILITNDRGFGDIRTYPPSSHYGVIVLKPPPHPYGVWKVHEVTENSLKERRPL